MWDGHSCPSPLKLLLNLGTSAQTHNQSSGFVGTNQKPPYKFYAEILTPSEKDATPGVERYHQLEKSAAANVAACPTLRF